MKILHTIHSAKLEGGGVIQAIIEVSSALSDRGVESEIACLDLPSISHAIPFKTFQLGEKNSSYGYSKKFKEWIRNHADDYHAIFIHGIWQFNSFGVFSALKKEQTPYYIFPHGMLDPYFASAFPAKHIKKWIYWKCFESKVFSRAKAICFTCEEEFQLAKQSFKPFQIQPSITGLGIKDPIQNQGVQSKEYQNQIPEMGSKPYLLFIGRIHPKKGVDLLIRSFSQLKGEKSLPKNLQLLIVGPSENRSYDQQIRQEYQAISESLRNSIHFYGMVQDSLKWSFLSNAEAMILPSHQENFGITVAESLALSIPVLISNKVNIWREVKNAEAGFVAEDTPEGTKQLLQEWTEYSEKEKLQVNARKCFDSHFNSLKTAHNIINLLKQS